MKPSRRIFLNQITSSLSMATLPMSLWANPIWPTKPVRIVVPVPPGGSLDTLARGISKQLSAKLGQTVVIENVAGGGSNIAFGQVAKAAPDGYTLLLGWDSLLINPSLYTSVPYKLEQFAQISLAITSPQVLLVGSKLPAKTLSDFLRIAREKNGGLTLANAGSGSPGHLAGTLFEKLTGVKFTNVPYKGGGPAVADLLAGHVDALMVTLPAALQYVRHGKLIALGVTSATRSTGASEIPTLAEAGVAGFELNSWQGLLAPAGTPNSVIAVLNDALVGVLRDPAVRDQLIAQGFEVVASTPETLATALTTLAPRWAQLVKDSGARVD